MATLRDIRRRIASIQNTRKITKAMEMVAAAKLRRAQTRIEALRPYARDMVEMMMDLATYADSAREFPLLRGHGKEEAVALVVVTGDRGFAGAFNANVMRRGVRGRRASFGSAASAVRWLVVGKKGIGTLRFRGVAARTDVAGQERPSGLQRRAGDRSPGRRPLRSRAGRQGAAHLQPLQVAHRADDHEHHAAAHQARRGDAAGRASRAGRATSTSQTRRPSSTACCRPTSRSPSTGRCSSRAPASRARA